MRVLLDDTGFFSLVAIVFEEAWMRRDYLDRPDDDKETVVRELPNTQGFTELVDETCRSVIAKMRKQAEDQEARRVITPDEDAAERQVHAISQRFRNGRKLTPQ